MIAKTPLHASHLAIGAKMVDFHGWEMPCTMAHNWMSTIMFANTPECLMSHI